MSAPLVVNTTDGTCWTRREGTRGGEALYAPEKCGQCPQFVMATYAELAEHGIAGSADALPMPVGPEPLSPEREAEIREWVEAMGRQKDIRYYGSWQQHGELLGEIDRLRARVAELEHTVQQMCDALNGHECPPPGETPMETVTRVAVRLMEAERQVAELEAEPLAWAEELDAKSLDNFLIALASATEHEPMDGAIDRIHELIRSFREAAQADDEREPDVDGVGRTYESYYPERSVKASADKLTRILAPTQALREDDGYRSPLHQEHRIPHDLPETGGAPC